MSNVIAGMNVEAAIGASPMRTPMAAITVAITAVARAVTATGDLRCVNSVRAKCATTFATNTTAALVSVPIFVWLGHWLWARFQDDLEQLNETLERTHAYSLWVTLLLVAAAAVGVWFWSRRTRRTA